MTTNHFIPRPTLLLILFIFSVPVSGQMFRKQSFFELEFGAGPVFLMADIGNVGIGGNLGIAGRYRLQDHLALRANLNGGIVFGNDAGTENESRGYKYYTYFGELTGQLEYWFLEEGRGFSSQGFRAYKPRVRPFIYAGGGPLLFKPNHYHEDADELEEFDSYAIILVAGAGFLYKVNADIYWGFQAGGRDALSSSTSSSVVRTKYPPIQTITSLRLIKPLAGPPRSTPETNRPRATGRSSVPASSRVTG